MKSVLKIQVFLLLRRLDLYIAQLLFKYLRNIVTKITWMPIKTAARNNTFQNPSYWHANVQVKMPNEFCK